MNQREIDELLKRFDEGNCTAEEERLLKSWFDKTSDKGTWAWSDSEKQEQEVRLKNRIDARIGNFEKRFILPSIALKVAASIILISTIGFFLWKEEVAIRNYIDPVIYLQSSTEPGKKVKIILADGTAVYLNAASKIRYPKKFNRDVRQVELLEGEAFFDVVHIKEKPFVVLAGKTRTQVLGTAFNVRSYKAFEDIQVTVSRGKVAVSEAGLQGKQVGAAVFLLPDDQLRFNRRTNTKLKTRAESDNVAGWTDGRLYFNNESLKYVAQIIGNTFNAKLSFKEKEMGDIRFTATFDNKDTFNEILFSIAKSNGLRYSQTGNLIVFKKKTN